MGKQMAGDDIKVNKALQKAKAAGLKAAKAIPQEKVIVELALAMRELVSIEAKFYGLLERAKDGKAL